MALRSTGVSLTPSPTQEVLANNYLDVVNFENQYLPDTVAQEFARYGNQSIKGFLEKTGSEVASNSQIIKWSEEGRLRRVGVGATRAANVFTLVDHNFRVNETIIFKQAGVENVGYVTAVADADTFTAVSNLSGGFTIGTTAITCFVYGSEFGKGTRGMEKSLEAQPDIYENSPVIIKDMDAVNGTDATQIGWIQDVETGGFYWYLKSRAQTRQRFDDVLETAMIEARSVENGSGAAGAGKKGTEGLFEALDEANVFDGLADSLADFDSILKRLDQQGAIEENMLFTNRDQSLAIDDMLAEQNSYGEQGTSFGVFDNSKEMALNLGFTGFRRGEYDFYKCSWKYLNDPTSRGAFEGTGKVNAVLTPAGTTNVYDEVMGSNATLPFLHVKYLSSPTEDRRYKTWMVGGAVGASNSDLDANELHFLSERALCVMGRNNFVKFVS
jgi:hypothetical protein